MPHGNMHCTQAYMYVYIYIFIFTAKLLHSKLHLTNDVLVYKKRVTLTSGFHKMWRIS